MEFAIVLQLLWRRRHLLVLGAPIAVILALLGTHRITLSPPGLAGASRTTAIADASVLIDTPSSQAVDLSPSGGDGVKIRADLLSSLLGSDAARANVARGASLRPDQIDIFPFTTGPALSTPLARRIAELDAPAQAAYVVRIGEDDILPIIRVDTSAPDAAGARRLAQATIAALGELAAPNGTEGAGGYAVRTLGPVRTTSLTSGPGHAKTAAVALAALFGLLLAVVFGTGAARVWHRLGDAAGQPAQS